MIEVQTTRLDRPVTASFGTLRAPAANSMGARPRRVLLVDDDETVLETVRCALLGRGYEVFIARDGAEALRRAELDAPDLVLLDVVMPKRSGLTVLDRLRNRQSGAPQVIMMSANAAQKQRDFATSRGAAGFLSKPFEIEELLSEVDAALQASTMG